MTAKAKKRRTVAECEMEIERLRCRLARSMREQRSALRVLLDDSEAYEFRVGWAQASIAWALSYAIDPCALLARRWLDTRPAIKARRAAIEEFMARGRAEAP